MFPRTLVISLLLHAALFVAVWLIKNQLPTPPMTPQVVEMVPAPVPAAPTIKLTPQASRQRLAKSGERRPGHHTEGSKGTPQLGLKDLGIAWNKKDGVSIPVGAERVEEGQGEGFGGSGKGGELLIQMKHTVAFEAIHERINTALYYPKEFEEHGIEGAVQVHLVIAKDGTFNRHQSSFIASSNFLRVFVHRILRNVLTHPLPPSYFRDGRDLKLRLAFQFDLRRKENAMDGGDNSLRKNPARGGTMGNYLSFYRAAAVFGAWKLGPLSGYGIVPAVGVDPTWFVDNVRKLASNKGEQDPLQKYRDDPEWAKD